MMALMFESSSLNISLPSFQERPSVQPDSSAFVADPELIRALETRATPVKCDADGVLFKQDDPAVGVYILQEGAATLTMTSHDGQLIFSVNAVPGSLLGLPALVSDKPYSLTATALAGAKVSFVSREHFLALVQSDPQLSLRMLQVLAAEVRTARQALNR
jgi:CRP/FNR family cyclic AMP-dependent transcriptional regulator